MKTITELDGTSVNENEASEALRVAAGARISQISLLAHSRTDSLRPRILSLCAYAQIITERSRNKPHRGGDQDHLWFSRVGFILSLTTALEII